MREEFLGDPRFSVRFRKVATSARWELYAGKSCRRAVAGGVTARSS
jgi:hypothetical protein